MTYLSININKFALIRNSRGSNTPDILTLSRQLLDLGADGITVHPRPDERHIRFDDLAPLCDLIRTHYKDKEFNIEGYPSLDFISIVKQVNPHQVTLVPDPPEALTSSFGWDVKKEVTFLKSVVNEFRKSDIRCSLFIDPTFKDFNELKEVNPDRIELYTYDYAHHFKTNKVAYIKDYAQLAEAVHNLGIKVNAGHDLNTENLRYFLNTVKNVKEVSIGHAFVCDCIQYGITETFLRYKKELI